MDDTHEREHAFAETLAEGRRQRESGFPLKREVAAFADTLLGLLFAQLSDDGAATADELQARLTLVRHELRHLVEPLVGADQAELVVASLAAELPGLYRRSGGREPR